MSRCVSRLDWECLVFEADSLAGALRSLREVQLFVSATENSAREGRLRVAQRLKRGPKRCLEDEYIGGWEQGKHGAIDAEGGGSKPKSDVGWDRGSCEFDAIPVRISESQIRPCHDC